jgi:hypothetical protein
MRIVKAGMLMSLGAFLLMLYAMATDDSEGPDATRWREQHVRMRDY